MDGVSLDADAANFDNRTRGTEAIIRMEKQEYMTFRHAGGRPPEIPCRILNYRLPDVLDEVRIIRRPSIGKEDGRAHGQPGRWLSRL
jgi:hypothetical protein